MATHTRPNGITIELPDDVALEEGGIPTRKVRGRRGPLPKGPIPLPSERSTVPSDDPVIAAMVEQDLVLADSFAMVPQPSARKRHGPDRSRLTIDLDPAEDSVVLFEQDGVFSWRFPQASETVVPPAARRGPVRLSPRRRVTFDLSVTPEPTPAARRTRGPVADFVIGKVRTYVFRFVARAAVKSGISLLERKKRTGLVHIHPTDLSLWSPIEALDALSLPADRPARILLLVHGTFSSTLGSFGALGVSLWGQAFLTRAAEQYDAIIGYDHTTLGRDPLQNAEDLLGRLERTKAPSLQIDAVAFSRGGLVLRSLIEYLLPFASLRARVHRAIFVGATNGGTQLAVKENWTRLIDLMTNLVVVGCRILSAIAPAAVAATIVRESISTLGALVKCLAAEAVDQDAVPGLAAMVPTGDFVTRLNQSQPGQPNAAESMYYVVSSEFDVKSILAGKGAAEFPARLARWVMDAVVDAAMREPNDLVVNTASMAAIDAETGGFVKDSWHFDQNPYVYHTIYFTREEVVRALTRWLGLEAAVVPLASGPTIPAGSDDRIVIVRADEPFTAALEAIRNTAPAYAIAERDTPWGMRYHYAYRQDELVNLGAGMDQAGKARSLEDAVRGTELEMHEGTSTPEAAIGELGAAPSHNGPTGERLIVLEGKLPRAVIERGASLAAAAAPPAPRATSAISPRRTRGGRTRGAGLPSAAPVTRNGGEEAQAAERGAVFVSGSMPASIPVGVVVPLEVAVSQDAIEITAGPTSGAVEAKVALDRSILIQAIPKRNLVLQGDDRFEVDPAARRTELVFDVSGVAPGEGEIWVVVRQGPVAVATLKLLPQVDATLAQPSASHTRTAADVQRANPDTETYPVLQIFEWQGGGALKYHFVLQLGPGNFVSGYSDEIKRPRDDYVAQMYKDIEDRWLSTKGDYDAFHDELRTYGATLLDELVPAGVQEALWNVRDTLTAIQVVAEEPFIPWELVHLKEPRGASGKPKPLPAEPHFLAQKGLIRWLHNRGPAPLALKVRKDRSFYVVPNYPHPDYELPEAQKEIPFLKKTFGAKELAPEITAIRDRLKTPGSMDHFHFAGHGEADLKTAVDAQLMLGGTIERGSWVPRYLKSDFVAQNAQLVGPDGAQPVVVLNACQIGRAGWRLSSIGGFAESFIRAGAGVFVGSLWSVGDAPSHDFSQAFYQAIKNGATLSRAAIAGREAARKAQDGTWLAYVVYGYPHATVHFDRP